MRKILKSIRIKNGYTHKSISEALSIGRSTYSKIELGYKNPSFLLGIKIKNLLNYKNDNIFENL